MWFAIVHIVREGWALLPAATTVLRFAAALIGFVIAARVLTRKIRRRLHRH